MTEAAGSNEAGAVEDFLTDYQSSNQAAPPTPSTAATQSAAPKPESKNDDVESFLTDYKPESGTGQDVESFLSDYKPSYQAKPEASGNLLTDVPKAVARGVAQLPEAIAGVGQTAASGYAKIADLAAGNQNQEYETKVASTLGNLRDATTRKLANSVTEALPYSSGTQAAQQKLEQDLSEIGQNKDASMLEKGVSAAKAAITNPRASLPSLVESVPQYLTAAKALKALDVGGSMLAQGVGLNALLEGAGGEQAARQDVLQKIPLATLRKSSTFQNLESQYGTDEARRIASEMAGTIAYGPAAALGGAASLVTGGGGETRMLSKVFEEGAKEAVAPGVLNTAKHFAKEIGKSAIREVPEETLQGASGQFAQNLAEQQYTGVDLGEGVAEQAGMGAAFGALGGGMFGAGGATMDMRKRAADTEQPEQEVQVVQTTPPPPATAPVTTAPVTTAPVTTAPVTTAPVTTAPVTTAPVTTAPVTREGAVTQAHKTVTEELTANLGTGTGSKITEAAIKAGGTKTQIEAAEAAGAEFDKRAAEEAAARMEEMRLQDEADRAAYPESIKTLSDTELTNLKQQRAATPWQRDAINAELETRLNTQNNERPVTSIDQTQQAALGEGQDTPGIAASAQAEIQEQVATGETPDQVNEIPQESLNVESQNSTEVKPEEQENQAPEKQEVADPRLEAAKSKLLSLVSNGDLNALTGPKNAAIRADLMRTLGVEGVTNKTATNRALREAFYARTGVPEDTAAGMAKRFSDWALSPTEQAAEQAPVKEPEGQYPIDDAGRKNANHPSNSQTIAQEDLEAGNYAKSTAMFNGIPLDIENGVGSSRSGTDAAGKQWTREMRDNYAEIPYALNSKGEIEHTVAADKDHLDAFIKPQMTADDIAKSNKVFVVDQNKVDSEKKTNTGQFDEAKVMLGYDSAEEAKSAYLRNYEDGWQGFGAMTEMTIPEFKEWMAKGDTRAPVAGRTAIAPELTEEAQFSRSGDSQEARPTKNTYAMPKEAQLRLVELFGEGINRLASSGVLNFTQGKETWPEAARNSARGDEEAVYVNGRVYVDVAATDKSRLKAVALHELGEHFNLRKMIGGQAYQSLQDQITNRAMRPGTEEARVWADVKRNYPDLTEGSEAYVSEVIAKLGERNSNTPWYRRLLSQIKSFLMKHGLARGIVAGTVTATDMHDLLVSSLRSAARGLNRSEAVFYGGDEQPAYSRPSDPAANAQEDDFKEQSWLEQVADKVDKMSDNLFSSRLAVLTVEQIAEVTERFLPGLKDYVTLLRERRAEIETLMRDADRIVSEVWKKLPARTQRALANVMHGSTLSDVDVSKSWTGVNDRANALGVKSYEAYTQAALTGLTRNILAKKAEEYGSSGSTKNSAVFATREQAEAFTNVLLEIERVQTQAFAAKGKEDHNANRKAEYDRLTPLYAALPAEAQSVYTRTHEQHMKLFNRRLEALEKRIEDADLDGKSKAAAIARLRQQFESNSLNWYYAPLQRFGKHWVYSIDQNGVKSFSTFESERKQQAEMKKVVEMGGRVVGNGTSLDGLQKINEGVSDTFITDIQNLVDEKLDRENPATKQLKEEIYQLYLSTLPEVSVRHNSMNRKGTKGFEQDAMRSFSNAIHHGATQLANMKYGREMDQVLKNQEKALDYANSPYLKEDSEQEIAAVQMLTEGNWERLNPGALEADLEEALNDGDEEQAAIIDRAIKLRDKFGGSSDVREALQRIEDRHTNLLKASEKIRPQDKRKAADALNEVRAAYVAAMNTNSSTMDRIASGLNQFNFMWMLGAGVSSFLVNTMQTPGVAMPITAGRFGVPKTIAAYGRAYSEFMRALRQQKKDLDGNVSITAILEEQFKELLAQGKQEEARAVAYEIRAMEIYKDGGDISRTRTFDLIGVGQEGGTHGGAVHDLSLKAGWMFHHGERFNREVTLLANYRLAREANKDSANKEEAFLEAVEYARTNNNRAHLEYSAENAARLFRGPMAKIALQFKKYQQGMLYLWIKSAADAIGKVNPDDYVKGKDDEGYKRDLERKRQARGTFIALLTVQMSMAGALSLPTMGLLATVYGMVGQAAGDDDDPWVLDKDIRLGLQNLAGDTGAEAITKGLFNAFTSINMASRLDQKDIFFHEPLKELEGRDLATNYAAQMLGPTGGSATKLAQGLSFIADGETLRGIEALAPKAIGDLVKTARFAEEGARTLDGMPLKDMSAGELFLQALGFGSSKLERKYAERGYAKGEEAAISDYRSKLIHDAARAQLDGKPISLQEIRDFNRRHPRDAILAQNVAASVKGIQKSIHARGERGYAVNPKLAELYDENDLMD